MPKLNLPKGEIYYEDHGAGEALVLVSGLTADHNTWGPIVPSLSKHYRVIVFDNFGTGQSSTPNNSLEPLTMKDFSEAVIALCDHLNIKRASFVGNSMGGAIVQQIAYDFPERVIKAVISNSFSYANHLAFQTYAKARAAGLAAGASDEFIVYIELALCFSGNFLTEEMVSMLKELSSNNPFPQTEEGYKAQLNALIAFDSRKWLGEIKIPCLFIASDEDAITFPSTIKSMADKVPNSEYLLISGPGHLPHIEQPGIFAEKLVEFLAA